MENLIYIKDSEGYVKGIYPNEMKPEYTIITKEEWAEESGEKYYKKHFTHGGARTGAGRKPKTGVVLKFQIRVSEKEKKLIQYLRENHVDLDKLMQN